MTNLLQQHAIINSKASIFDVTFTSLQRKAIESAMHEYSIVFLKSYQADQNKEVNLEAIKLFPSLWKGSFRLWLRKRSFRICKKEADAEAIIQNRPMYVIRATQIKYIVESSQVARELTKRRFYKKGTNSVVLTKTADYTAYPPRNPLIPKRRESGSGSPKPCGPNYHD